MWSPKPAAGTGPSRQASHAACQIRSLQAGFRRVTRDYEEEKRAAGGLDIYDLVNMAVHILRQNNDARDPLGFATISLVLIDDCQDLTPNELGLRHIDIAEGPIDHRDGQPERSALPGPAGGPGYGGGVARKTTRQGKHQASLE